MQEKSQESCTPQSFRVSHGLTFPKVHIPVPPVNLQLTPFISGMVSPICLRDQGDYLYVADQIGLIYKINRSTKESRIFLDIRDKLVDLRPDYDERGLLAFTFHPEYSNSNSSHYGRFFVFYSAKILDSVATLPSPTPSTPQEHKGDPPTAYYNQLSEFSVSSNQDIVNRNSEIILFNLDRDYTYHNGADLHFGPDGYLYISIGDSGPQEDHRNNAQNLSVPYGKILRIDVSDQAIYRIPSDNPFIGVPNALPEIFALGFRNPWRMSFDSAGRLFVGDVGHEKREEINIVMKGCNYGWNMWEGTWETPWGRPQDKNKMVMMPIYEYEYRPGTSAVIGGYFINDEVGYIFGDYNKLIMRIVENKMTGQWQLVQRWNVSGFIKSFGQDHDGNLYVLISEHGPEGRTGTVYTINIK